jgi:hypothetical protein
MEKHGTHDQKTHGSWAHGSSWQSGSQDGQTMFIYKGDKGKLTITIPDEIANNPEYKDAIDNFVTRVEEIQNAYPLPDLEIRFSEGESTSAGHMATTYSAALDGIPQSTSMDFSEAVLKSPVGGGLAEYVLAHEWGHGLDTRTRAIAKAQGTKLSQAQFEDSDIPMTSYGYQSDREAYAEAFAVKYNNSYRGGVWRHNIEQTEKWEEVFKIFELDSLKKAKGERVSFLVQDTFDDNNPPTLIEDYEPPVAKHGTHDQKTHGSWATDGNSFDKIEAEGEILMAEWRKKYRALTKYLDSKGMTRAWREIQADPKAKKMQAEVDAVWEKQAALSNKFYAEHFAQNETEDFDRLRDKFVVADTPTLKMNKQLREGGGLTQRVKDADALCAMGVVKERVGVYRGAILPQEMVDSLKVGTSFVDKGFQSTDVDKSSAEFYAESRKSAGAEGTGVIFRMTLNKGLNAVDVSYGEVVVQRNATMTVTKKSKSGDWTIIDVEVSK